MKLTTNVNMRVLAMTLVAVMMFGFSGATMAKEMKEETVAVGTKTFEKAKAAVESAEQGDWKTLAKSAKKLIRKNQNLEEASAWLDKSIAIEANSTNLAYKGDYYKAKGDLAMAKKYYIKALTVAKDDKNFDPTALQQKIADLLAP